MFSIGPPGVSFRCASLYPWREADGESRYDRLGLRFASPQATRRSPVGLQRQDSFALFSPDGHRMVARGGALRATPGVRLLAYRLISHRVKH